VLPAVEQLDFMDRLAEHAQGALQRAQPKGWCKN
jgi:hypothetical protein